MVEAKCCNVYTHAHTHTHAVSTGAFGWSIMGVFVLDFRVYGPFYRQTVRIKMKVVLPLITDLSRLDGRRLRVVLELLFGDVLYNSRRTLFFLHHFSSQPLLFFASVLFYS